MYITSNFKRSVLYVGVTSSLVKRVYEHKNKLVEGFTKKYNLSKLVYFETTNDVKNALIREKQLKNWHRDWKLNIINKHNPEWKDLSEEWDD